MTDNILTEKLNGDIAAALEAGERLGANIEPHDGPDGTLYFPVPLGYRLEQIKPLTPILAQNVSQSEKLIEQDSFVGYVNRFKQSHTIIKAFPASGSMRAVIDYHQPSTQAMPALPNYGTHICTLECGFDPNWDRWRTIDRKSLSQEEFAYFIEEMLHTIGAPDGADLLEMAQTLKINRGVIFKANKRLKDGTIDIEYTESDEISSSRGHVAVPDEITIVCPIYMFRVAQTIKAKLRYRVAKGEPLQFRIDILNAKLIEFEAFRVMAEEVRAATGQPVFIAG